MTTGMMSSLTDDWGTPSEFYATLNHEFGFTLDVAASATNAKCPRYFSIDTDGLSQPWAPETCWMNPPYGRGIGAWMAKAWHEATLGATVVGLIPARTDTAWWHNYVAKAAEIRFVRGRLKFDGTDRSRLAAYRHGSITAPFPSAVVVWRP
jgi:site-specific DNA-methyltransferase (adenine-specific)